VSSQHEDRQRRIRTLSRKAREAEMNNEGYKHRLRPLRPSPTLSSTLTSHDSHHLRPLRPSPNTHNSPCRDEDRRTTQGSEIILSARQATQRRRRLLEKVSTVVIVYRIVMFRPGLAQKPRLWLGLKRLWLSQNLGRAKAPTDGLALARLGPSPGFWQRILA
jgi:hypothetical protein